MDAFQPAVAFNGLGVNISSAKALIEEYDRELSEVEVLITHVEDDRREDERVLRSSKEAMRLQLQGQIDDLRAQELVEAAQLEATSQARRAPLDEKRKSILDKIDVVKHSIAPIRNIPAEILGYIFREVVALNVAPWLLTTVNKSWRRTALTNPWLWSNIIIGGSHDDFSLGEIRSRWLVDGISRPCHGNAVVCRTLDELAYSEEKFRAVLLDVQMYFQGRGAERQVLQHLFGPNFSSRIRSLSLVLGVDLKEAPEWPLGPLPSLQQLSCDSIRGSLIGSIMSQTHQLKDLKVVSLSHNPPKYPFWKTLRTLDLGWQAHASELNQVISELQLIEVIEGSPINWPNIDTPVVTLQHIKSIDLTCNLQYIARLRLPRLEKLVWFSSPSSSYFSDFNFSTEPDWGLSLPNLVELEACAAGKAFAVALRELPNIQTALFGPIHSRNSKDPWVLDLIQSLIGAEVMLCPKLRHLTLKNLKANKTLTKPLIRRLITSRKALGMPFTHFQIVWARRSGKSEEAIQYA